MENFENWNKNVRNKNSDENQRDYDKEPIVIKDYHQIFNSVLSWFSAFVAFVILLNLYVFIYGCLLNLVDDELLKEVRNITIINAIAIFILLLYFVIGYYIFIIRRKAEIRFTNEFIQFYEFEKVQHNSANQNLRNIVCKPFWLDDIENNGIVWAIIMNCIIALVAFKFVGLLFIVFYFLANIFLKGCFYMIVKRNLKDFTPFFSIIVDEPQKNGWAYNINVLRGKFYMVCIFDKKDYLEIKKWFLDKKNINIDYIQKKYFA
ncbi:hypothetical protein [Campylobacter sp. JMF_08 NE1]|uniref:hypothetical protein n=1 Tax=Campylobacter sp. JMF_08 NE1 TaxID=2983821 RepID=UPI0022E9AD96|nr:hypothetical protein [Campylobacter sp. JMF_08 NE1]MDA3047197.1 hypothetical protein [Campylobacter sp. JMF_08 NE1]